MRDSTGARGPYAYSGKLWISYDDTEDIRRKVSLFFSKVGTEQSPLSSSMLDFSPGDPGENLRKSAMYNRKIFINARYLTTYAISIVSLIDRFL